LIPVTSRPVATTSEAGTPRRSSASTVSLPSSSWDPYERGCLSRGLLDRIGDKWTVLVLGEFAKHGACRFTHLRKGLSGVSEKMLTEWSVQHIAEVLAAREEYDDRAERAS
jgi:DNA-binding HxlR family transcriptional regulator